jgi:AcrR family transcriptional regulator
VASFHDYYERYLRKLPKQSRSWNVVTSILTAAIENIVAGEADVIVSKVSMRAGVGIGSLYDYFRGEKELLSAALVRLTELNVSRFEQNLDAVANAPLTTLVAALWDMAFDTYTRKPRMLRAALRIAHSNRLVPLVSMHQSAFARRLADVFRNRSDVRVHDIDAAAYVITHGVIGLCIAEAWGERPPTTEMRALGIAAIVRFLMNSADASKIATAGPTKEPAAKACNNEAKDGLPPGSDPDALPDDATDFLKRAPKQGRARRVIRRLLVEVKRSLAERGDEVVVSEVARMAGVRLASVYDYFSTGSDLVAFAIVDAADKNLNAFSERIEEARAKNQSEHLELIEEAFVRYTRDPRFVRAVLTTVNRLDIAPVLMHGRRAFIRRAIASQLAATDDGTQETRLYLAVHSIMGIVHVRIWEDVPLFTEEALVAAATQFVTCLFAQHTDNVKSSSSDNAKRASGT